MKRSGRGWVLWVVNIFLQRVDFRCVCSNMYGFEFYFEFLCSEILVVFWVFVFVFLFCFGFVCSCFEF